MKSGGRLAILAVTVVGVVCGGSGCADPAVRPVESVRALKPDSGPRTPPGVRMLSDGPEVTEVGSIRSAADARAAVAARANRQNKPNGRAAQPSASESFAGALDRTSIPTMGIAGLVPNARRLAEYIAATYPGVQSIGGVRADPLPDHPTGHAIDIMVGSDMGLGDIVNADIQRQSGRFGVVYTLWRVANHYNHVHVTVS